jgi:hypothetical protein
MKYDKASGLSIKFILKFDHLALPGKTEQLLRQECHSLCLNIEDE